MANKTSELDALAGEGVAAADYLPIVDATGPTSKKITVAEFHETFPVTITAEMTGSSAAATDELIFFDAGVPKTIALSEFFATWPAAVTAELTGAGVADADEFLISDAGVPKTIAFSELVAAVLAALDGETEPTWA